jgi:putative DNA primase/helicase
MLRAKSNIGLDGGGFVYALAQASVPGKRDLVASVAAWGKGVEGNARELLADAEASPDDAPARDAADFLRDLLSYGPAAANAIYKEAEAAGYSRDQMKRAKHRLGIAARKDGMRGGWLWQLPNPQESTQGHEGSEAREQNCSLCSHPSVPDAPPSEAEHGGQGGANV